MPALWLASRFEFYAVFDVGISSTPSLKVVSPLYRLRCSHAFEIAVAAELIVSMLVVFA